MTWATRMKSRSTLLYPRQAASRIFVSHGQITRERALDADCADERPRTRIKQRVLSAPIRLEPRPEALRRIHAAGLFFAAAFRVAFFAADFFAIGLLAGAFFAVVFFGNMI